jgi:hypothetical protein
MNDELERIWKEAAYFKVLSQYLLGGTQEKHDDLSQNSRPQGIDLNS